MYTVDEEMKNTYQTNPICIRNTIKVFIKGIFIVGLFA